MDKVRKIFSGRPIWMNVLMVFWCGFGLRECRVDSGSPTRIAGFCLSGMTGNLLKRVDQHRNDRVEGFTKKYGVHSLVYFEQFRDVRAAIGREKQLKKWERRWKIELIEKGNPGWRDLFLGLVEAGHS